MKLIRKSKLKSTFQATVRQLKHAVTLGSNAALEEMQQRVPVDEGDLKSTLKNSDKGDGYAEITVGGESASGKFVDYEFPVEFGSAHENYSIPAQPFFRPGVDKGKQVMKKNLKIVKK